MLDVRRQYPGLIVGAISVASVVPAVHARSPRLFLRNLFVGGGGAMVLLYPEFVHRAVNYWSKSAPHLKERLSSRLQPRVGGGGE